MASLSRRVYHVLRRAGAALPGRGRRARHARPRGPVTAPRRPLHTVRHAPPAWSATASTGRQRPPAHLPRAAAWPQVLLQNGTPVRPYVLPPAERAAARMQGGAR